MENKTVLILYFYYANTHNIKKFLLNQKWFLLFSIVRIIGIIRVTKGHDTSTNRESSRNNVQRS